MKTHPVTDVTSPLLRAILWMGVALLSFSAIAIAENDSSATPIQRIASVSGEAGLDFMCQVLPA